MSEKINIEEPIAEICERLGLVKSYVRRIDFRPTTVEVEVLKGQDGRFQGSKYIDEDGDAAVETLAFEVIT